MVMMSMLTLSFIKMTFDNTENDYEFDIAIVALIFCF